MSLISKSQNSTPAIIFSFLGFLGLFIACSHSNISAAPLPQLDLLDNESLQQLPAPQGFQNLSQGDRTKNQPEQNSPNDAVPNSTHGLEQIGNSSQFVVTPFARPSNIKIDVQNGKISLVARGAPLRDVLSLLAEKHDLNLVMAQDAQVPITLTLNGVSLMDALEAVVSVAGYTWTSHRGILHISSISSTNTLTPHVQGRQTRVFELDYVSAIDLDTAIQGMLSPSGRSQIMVSDPQNNRRTKEVIVVEDFPAFLHRIEQYVAQVDIMPRQVLIQVHVLEVDLDDENRHGINLENFVRLGGGNIRINTVGLANAVAGQAILAEINGTDVDALLEALETNTNSDTLASPRIVAMNGQESRLQIGEKLGFRTSTTTQTSTQENIQFLDVGVVLNVTPRITRDENVLLYIKPEVSSGEINESTGLPSEATSEVETNLVVGSGQGIVIGGLIQERQSFSESQAPVLGNIKGLGWMFRRRAYTTDRSEIIFVLVPHILPQGFVPEPWQGHGELVNNSQHLPKIQFNQQFGPGYNVNSQSDCGVAPPAPEQTAQPQSQHIMVPAEQNLHLNHQQQLRQPYQQQWQPRPHQQFRREQIQAPLYYPTSNHRPQQPLPRAQPTDSWPIQKIHAQMMRSGGAAPAAFQLPASRTSNFVQNAGYQIQQVQQAPNVRQPDAMRGRSFSFSDRQ